MPDLGYHITKLVFDFMQFLSSGFWWVIVGVLIGSAIIAIAILLSNILRDRALYDVAEQIIRAIVQSRVRETRFEMEVVETAQPPVYTYMPPPVTTLPPEQTTTRQILQVQTEEVRGEVKGEERGEASLEKRERFEEETRLEREITP